MTATHEPIATERQPSPSQTTPTGVRRGLPLVAAPAFRLSVALVVVSASASAFTFFADDVLAGPAVSVGSARGTALVVLLVALPAMVTAMVRTARGSSRGLIVWLGAAGFLLYNAQLFLFGTPLNRLFLLYVAMLSLSLWAILALLHETDVPALARRFDARTPVRGVATYAIVVAVVNELIWLKGIAPAITGDPSALMAGTGMTTNPVYIQDLAFWLPMVILTSTWLWRRRPWGYLAVSASLVLWVLEAVSIATDQWFSHAADPPSPLASVGMVPAFAAVAVIGMIPLVLMLRRLHAGERQ